MLLNILDFFLTPSKEKPVWMDFLQMAVPLLIFIWGFLRAYKAWERQKKKEIGLNLEQKRYESKIDACKNVWALLAYMSEKENHKTIFVDRNEGKYFLRKAQGEEYINKLPEVFFEKGSGIFMPREIIDDLYTFRSKIYKLLDTARGESNSEMIEIQKAAEIKKNIHEIRTRLNRNLKNAILNSDIEFKEE